MAGFSASCAHNNGRGRVKAKLAKPAAATRTDQSHLCFSLSCESEHRRQIVVEANPRRDLGFGVAHAFECSDLSIVAGSALAERRDFVRGPARDLAVRTRSHGQVL